MENNFVIYKHTNKFNGKSYIGQTKNELNRRWKNGNGYKDSPLFWAAIQKYGWENFTHEILEQNLSADQANDKEIYWIAKYKTNDEHFGYNLTPGGNNYMASLWQNQQYRANMCKSFSENRKKKIADGSFYNDCLMPMLNGIHRVWNDPVWREQRINNIMGDKNPNSKKVYNVETGKIFNTIKEAAAWCGLNAVSGIGQCCRNQRKTSGKHPVTGQPLHWKFYNDEGRD